MDNIGFAFLFFAIANIFPVVVSIHIVDKCEMKPSNYNLLAFLLSF